jgi:hypothetical protein
MHPIIKKTFGGLSASYYFRQFFFGAILTSFYYLILSHGSNGSPTPLGVYILFAINAALYPYARFVYESIADFIMGNTVFITSAFLMLFLKLITMVICWAGAMLIAPIGLIYLYIYHTKQEAA